MTKEQLKEFKTTGMLKCTTNVKGLMTSLELLDYKVAYSIKHKAIIKVEV